MVSEKKSKMSQPIRGLGSHLVFLITMTNAKMEEDIEILLPDMFLLIPFNGFRGEVKSVSSNQRLRWPSYLSDRPKIHKLDRGHWDRASCQVSLNFSVVAEKKSKMSQPIRGRGGHLVFLRLQLAWNDTNWVGDVEILLPVNFRWIPFSGLKWEVENVSAN